MVPLGAITVQGSSRQQNQSDRRGQRDEDADEDLMQDGAEPAIEK